MNIYLLQQNENRGYDTYDSIIVYAENEDNAKLIRPEEYTNWEDPYSAWASSPNKVHVTYIGSTDEDVEEEVILASFNAG